MKAGRFIGCLLGTAVGDSLGAGGEGILDTPENVEIGPRYTDDTAMMIGVAESLIECHGFNPEHMMGRFVKNFEHEPWRGYASGPPRIFRWIRSGRRWDEGLDQEIFPEGSFGNGAAMRVAPIGLFYCDNPEELRSRAFQSGRLTHTHELALEGAALEACAVALALKITPPDFVPHEFLGRLIDFTRNEAYRKKLQTAGKLLSQHVSRREIISELGHGVEALHSVPTAIYSFLANRDFSSTVTYAVSLGGDTDTIGAMAGAIAGAGYGVDEIPAKWLNQLENRVFLEGLARRLWEIKS